MAQGPAEGAGPLGRLRDAHPRSLGQIHIARGLEHAGYVPLAEPCSFIVTGTYGPLQDGELQRARLWGADLAKAME